MQEKLKSKLNSGEIFILFSSKYFVSVSSKNTKIKINRNATLPGFLYWHETCFFTLQEANGPRVVQGKVTMILFTMKGKEITEV